MTGRGRHGNHARGLDHPAAKAWKPFCGEQWLRTRYVIDGASQAEIARDASVSLKRVQTAMRRFGIPPRRQVKRNQTGAANASWTGDAATYAALHKRVEAVRGKPAACDVCGMSDSARLYDWANLTGHYEDVLDYQRMCRPCHRAYDRARGGGARV